MGLRPFRHDYRGGRPRCRTAVHPPDPGPESSVATGDLAFPLRQRRRNRIPLPRRPSPPARHFGVLAALASLERPGVPQGAVGSRARRIACRSIQRRARQNALIAAPFDSTKKPSEKRPGRRGRPFPPVQAFEASWGRFRCDFRGFPKPRSGNPLTDVQKDESAEGRARALVVEAA